MSVTWPGNVRELRNVLERACMLADGPTLTERDVSAAMPAARTAVPAPAATPPEGLEAVEREHIVRVLGEAARQQAGRRPPAGHQPPHALSPPRAARVDGILDYPGLRNPATPN